MRRAIAVAGLVVAVVVGAWAGGLPKVLPDLAEVGTIGNLPPAAETILVHVHADGTLFIDGKQHTFVEFRTGLRGMAKPPEPLARHGVRASPTNVLLYIDKTLPWQAMQWLLTVCAESKLNRVWHAVRPEGGGDVGAMGMFLPTDKGIRPMVPMDGEIFSFDVQVTDQGVPLEPAQLYPALKKALAMLAGNNRSFSIMIKARPAMPSGYVLRVIDVCMRAGLDDIDLYGVAIPPRDANLKQLVAKLRLQWKGDRLPGIRLAGTLLEPVEGGPPMPVVPRKQYAGIFHADVESGRRSRH